jgi:hypothetical protein
MRLTARGYVPSTVVCVCHTDDTETLGRIHTRGGERPRIGSTCRFLCPVAQHGLTGMTQRPLALESIAR